MPEQRWIKAKRGGRWHRLPDAKLGLFATYGWSKCGNFLRRPKDSEFVQEVCPDGENICTYCGEGASDGTS